MEEKQYVLYFQEIMEGFKYLSELENSDIPHKYIRDERPPKPGFVIRCTEKVAKKLKERFVWITEVKPHQEIYLELVKDWE